MSGIIEIQLGGDLKTLRFNNWQKEALGKILGTDPLAAGKLIVERIKESYLLVACDLIYTGLIGNYRVQRKDIDFTMDDIVIWVGDAANDEITVVFDAWIESTGLRDLLPGNDSAKKKVANSE